MRAIGILSKWMKGVLWAALLLGGLLVALFALLRWSDSSRLRGMRAQIEQSLPEGCEVEGWFSIRTSDTMNKEGGMRLATVAFVRGGQADGLAAALAPLVPEYEGMELQPCRRNNRQFLENRYFCGTFGEPAQQQRRLKEGWQNIPELNADFMIFVTDVVRRGWPTDGWPGQEIFRYSPG